MVFASARLMSREAAKERELASQPTETTISEFESVRTPSEAGVGEPLQTTSEQALVEGEGDGLPLDGEKTRTDSIHINHTHTHTRTCTSRRCALNIPLKQHLVCLISRTN